MVEPGRLMSILMSMVSRALVIRTFVMALAGGATAAGLATAGMIAPPGSITGIDPTIQAQFTPQSNSVLTSFPEIVEAVKSSVIGVRVAAGKNKNGEHRSGSPVDQFVPIGAPDDAPDIPEDRAPNIPDQVSMTQGSGFFISADGYAVTNGHVVEGSDIAEIKTDDAKTYTAKIVGIDPVTDIALLKVDGGNDFSPVKLADKTPRVGEWVLAIGNPFGLDGTVTAGIVSSGKRNVGTNAYEDLIQIDAPVNQGNSGGPTFDVDGNVIGVNTMIVSPTGGSIGIAFAIPADTLKTVIPQLKNKGFVTRGWMGVQFRPVNHPDTAEDLGLVRGAVVGAIQAEGPAAAAGVAPGDIIASVDGEPIGDVSSLIKKIREMQPGATVTLGVLRKGQQKDIIVTLGELPVKRQARAATERQEQKKATSSGGASGLGLKLAPARALPSVGGGKGVAITGIEPSGSAGERGLAIGDVIIEVAGQAVSTPAEVRDALSKARDEGKRFVLMQLRSGETTRFVAVPPDPA
jgi:serine protease Do